MKGIVILILSVLLISPAFALSGRTNRVFTEPTGITADTVEMVSAATQFKPQAVHEVLLIRDSQGTGRIFVGSSDVDSDPSTQVGMEITGPCVRVRPGNMSNLYYVGDVDGDKLNWIGEKR